MDKQTYIEIDTVDNEVNWTPFFYLGAFLTGFLVVIFIDPLSEGVEKNLVDSIDKKIGLDIYRINLLERTLLVNRENRIGIDFRRIYEESREKIINAHILSVTIDIVLVLTKKVVSSKNPFSSKKVNDKVSMVFFGLF